MELGALVITGLRMIVGMVYPPLKKKYFEQPKVQIRLTGNGGGFRPGEFVNEDYYQHPENRMNRLQMVHATWKRNLIFLNHSEHGAYNLKILNELNNNFSIEPPVDTYKPVLPNSEINHVLKFTDTFTRREREAHGDYPAPDDISTLKILLEYTNVKGTKFYTSYDNSLDEGQKNKFLKKKSHLRSMITNRIVEIFAGILSLISIPVVIVTQLVFNLLITVSFGLLLIPISLIWMVLFMGPLLSLSYIYEKVGFLRIPASIIGIPVALLGYEFSALLPSMGEPESRISKLLLCHCFPYSWHFFQFSRTKPSLKESKGYPYLLQVFNRIPYKDKKSWEYVVRLKFLNGIA